MKLSLEQIKAIAFGWDHIWEEDGKTFFRRCTPGQVEAWGKLKETLGERARASSGIRFDFHTDSSQFSFRPVAQGPYDLYVDDVLVDSITWKDYALTDGWVRLELPEGQHRVLVVFPSHNTQYTSMWEVHVDDGASLEPHVYDRKILFIGDSITQGASCVCDSMSYAWRTSRALNADCMIQGIGGGFFAPKAFPHQLNFDPDVVIVAFGTNDWGFFSGPDRMELRSREYLDLLCETFAGKTLIGISPLWRVNNQEVRSVGTFQECCDIVRNAVRSHGMILIDGMELVPHRAMFFADGLHPNNLGYATYADNLVAKLRTILK